MVGDPDHLDAGALRLIAVGADTGWSFDAGVAMQLRGDVAVEVRPAGGGAGLRTGGGRAGHGSEGRRRHRARILPRRVYVWRAPLRDSPSPALRSSWTPVCSTTPRRKGVHEATQARGATTTRCRRTAVTMTPRGHRNPAKGMPLRSVRVRRHAGQRKRCPPNGARRPPIALQQAAGAVRAGGRHARPNGSAAAPAPRPSRASRSPLRFYVWWRFETRCPSSHAMTAVRTAEAF